MVFSHYDQTRQDFNLSLRRQHHCGHRKPSPPLTIAVAPPRRCPPCTVAAFPRPRNFAPSQIRTARLRPRSLCLSSLRCGVPLGSPLLLFNHLRSMLPSFRHSQFLLHESAFHNRAQPQPQFAFHGHSSF